MIEIGDFWWWFKPMIYIENVCYKWCVNLSFPYTNTHLSLQLNSIYWFLSSSRIFLHTNRDRHSRARAQESSQVVCMAATQKTINWVIINAYRTQIRREVDIVRKFTLTGKFVLLWNRWCRDEIQRGMGCRTGAIQYLIFISYACLEWEMVW